MLSGPNSEQCIPIASRIALRVGIIELGNAQVAKLLLGAYEPIAPIAAGNCLYFVCSYSNLYDPSNKMIRHPFIPTTMSP